MGIKFERIPLKNSRLRILRKFCLKTLRNFREFLLKTLGGGEEDHLDRNDAGRESGDVQVLCFAFLTFFCISHFFCFAFVTFFVFLTFFCFAFHTFVNTLYFDHIQNVGGALLYGSSCGENCWSTHWSVDFFVF